MTKLGLKSVTMVQICNDFKLPFHNAINKKYFCNLNIIKGEILLFKEWTLIEIGLIWHSCSFDIKLS